MGKAKQVYLTNIYIYIYIRMLLSKIIIIIKTNIFICPSKHIKQKIQANEYILQYHMKLFSNKRE